MSEYWFYHLETSMLEGVLPELLDKTRQRGWRAIVKMPDARVKEMDQFLWTYKDDSFLPHGRDDEPLSDQQPIVLSASIKTSEGFDCAFLVDGENLEIVEKTQRCIVMIDGRNESWVQSARALWKTLKESESSLSYWQQNDRGHWEKKA